MRVDCHVHVFDPDRFPYASDTFYRPSGSEIGTPSLLSHVLDAHDVRHALLVGPNSGYGLDNRCMLDALSQGKGRYKGIAVVPNDTGRAQLQELKGLGVIGIAFNVALLGVDFYRNIGPLLERLRELDMWAQVQVEGDQLVSMRPLLVNSGVRLLFDHCGRPFPKAGIGQLGFVALLELAETGRACVKLSSLSKSSAMPFPHPDARRSHRAPEPACPGNARQAAAARRRPRRGGCGSVSVIVAPPALRIAKRLQKKSGQEERRSAQTRSIRIISPA